MLNNHLNKKKFASKVTKNKDISDHVADYLTKDLTKGNDY